MSGAPDRQNECSEIEVTPPMIAAGASAVDEFLFRYDYQATPMGPYTRQAMARAVFEAMLQAKATSRT